MQEFLLKNALLQERPPLVHNNIEQEFLSLPQYRVKEPPEHLRPFARHPDVWCYEHNRYISPHDPHFWIDASVYENGFIATMGPLDGTDFEGAADTRPHFWQMVQESGCQVIVMTTDLYEGPLLKCSQYWPDKEEEYGNHRVKKVGEQKRDAILVRNLEVDGRAIKHIHLLNWPDHGAFSSLSELDWAVDEVKNSRGNAPVIVHCSAGVGRTGSFICSYIIKEAMRLGLYINLPKLVTFLRQKGRVKSVQELDQYKMLYSYAKKCQ